MIRRSPTRLELKLEDLGDFDYIQKYEKKKAPTDVPVTVDGISAQIIREDRIGFRPIRTGAGAGSASGATTAGEVGNGATTTAGDVGSATTPAEDAGSGAATVGDAGDISPSDI